MTIKTTHLHRLQVWRSLVVVVCLTAAGSVYAQDRRLAEDPHAHVYQLDVEGLILQDALVHLVDSTAISLVYDVDLVAAKQTTCRTREATAEALLVCVLYGTGLIPERLSSGTYVLHRGGTTPHKPVVPAPHTISGFVYDAASGESLSDAAVYETVRRIGTTTDDGGYYRFSVSADSARLSVSHLGYDEARFTLKLHGHVARDIRLNPSLLWLDSLSVFAERDDDEHPTRGRALYGHVRGFYVGALGPATIPSGTRAGLLLGYRFRGLVDLGLFASKQSGQYIVGPTLGFATRPSARGWGGRARLVYRVGLEESSRVGGTLIATADTVFRPTEGPVVVRGDTLPVVVSPGRGQPDLLGITFSDHGYDADVSVYKRLKLDGAAVLFPSLGLFAASSSVKGFGADRAGLQATLPFVLGLNSRTRLVIEPVVRLSLPDSDFGMRQSWSLDARLNL